jgi:hypothetical protein
VPAIRGDLELPRRKEAAGGGMGFKRSSSRCRMFSSSVNELRRVHVKQLQLQLQHHACLKHEFITGVDFLQLRSLGGDAGTGPFVCVRTFHFSGPKGDIMLDTDEEGGDASSDTKPPSRNLSLNSTRAGAEAAVAAFDAVSSLPSASPPCRFSSPALRSRSRSHPRDRCAGFTITPFIPIFAQTTTAAQEGKVGPFKTKKSIVLVRARDLKKRQLAIFDELHALDLQMALADQNPHGLDLSKHISKIISSTDKRKVDSDRITEGLGDRSRAKKKWKRPRSGWRDPEWKTRKEEAAVVDAVGHATIQPGSDTLYHSSSRCRAVELHASGVPPSDAQSDPERGVGVRHVAEAEQPTDERAAHLHAA